MQKRVLLGVNQDSAHYHVCSNSDFLATGLDLGDALAVLWERVSFLLVDDLRDAIVLHAAALCQNDGLLLIPGRSGSGKTRLSLWYRALGFDLGTDEIVSISAEPGKVDGITISGALLRPLILKSSADLTDLLRVAEVPLAQCDSSFGSILKLQNGNPWPERTFRHSLIIFPQFSAGMPLSLTALTPGEACVHLLANCLNVRNLTRGGLSLAASIARRASAILLRYGETAQLERTMDVLTRQLLATRPNAEDLKDLCEAFTARVVAQNSDGTVAQTVNVAPKRVIPPPSVERFPRRLTIGMATYDDYDGVYFTIQSMRFANPELKDAIEFIVIDNNPGGPCSKALSDIGKSIDAYRYIPRGEWSGTAIRNAVFEEAGSPFVLCIDSHVLISPGALLKLIEYFEADRECRDLLHGPMIYDDLRNIATHMDPQWRGGMYGTWGEDLRGSDPTATAFEIPMHGLGLFACRRTAWPGFHPKFRGFGGEEGYIHEKIRQQGGRILCLPFLRWLHRFDRPLGVPYLNRWEDRIRNYLIGFNELGMDTTEMEAHFAELLGAQASARIFAEMKAELNGRPAIFEDSIRE